jgi:hypothetical protein
MQTHHASNYGVQKYISHSESVSSDQKLKSIAYSMDALVPGFFAWIGPIKLRFGGCPSEPNYSGTLNSFAGVALVLPGYRIYSTHSGSYDPR